MHCIKSDLSWLIWNKNNHVSIIVNCAQDVNIFELWGVTAVDLSLSNPHVVVQVVALVSGPVRVDSEH